MKRLTLIIALAAAIMCAKAQEQTFVLKINDFNELTVANGVNVRYRSVPDSAGMAVYTCPKAVASALTFANDKNKLKIQVSAEQAAGQLPTVTVYSMALTKVSNWGDSTVVVESANSGATFKASVIGNGRIEAYGISCTKAEASVEAGMGHVFISGKCYNAKYTIMSAGAVEAGTMEADEAKCVMAGTGSIDCWATQKLTVMGIGSGHVYYRGDPSVKNRCIGVKIDKM